MLQDFVHVILGYLRVWNGGEIVNEVGHEAVQNSCHSLELRHRTNVIDMRLCLMAACNMQAADDDSDSGGHASD